jgi:glutaminyl-tRNA synthetase
LEHAVREDLNKKATRVSVVLDPIKLVLTNYPEEQTEWLDAQNNPEDPEAGSHKILFSKELYIERDDFMEDAPKKYFRLTPGQEVRLKNAYIVKCTGCSKDASGNITEVYAEYDPLTKSGMAESNRKIKGTIHWVSTQDAIDTEVRLYDRLFMVEDTSEDKGADFRDLLNPNSLIVKTNCKAEPFVREGEAYSHYQFQRIGYFNIDPDSTPERLIFNRTVTLKDSWSKIKDK